MSRGLDVHVLLAAALRPNAIDLRVDALPARILLSRSAAQLVDAERQIAALRLVHWYLPGWFLGVVFPVLALAYFWQSGRAAALRDALRRRLASEGAVRFLFGAALGLVVRLAALIPSLYLYRLERLMSQSDQLLRSWSIDWLLVTLAWMVALGLVTACVLWLVDRTHQWYLYVIAIIFVASFGITFAEPFAGVPALDHLTQMPPSTRRAIAHIEGVARLAPPVVELIRARSHLGTAYVSGLGGSQRIVIGNAIVAVAGPLELEYVLARELGNVATGAQWKIALTDALMLIFGIAIAVAISDRIGFRRDDDAVARLALVAAFIGVLYLVAVPVDNFILRDISAGADAYALTLHVDRAAAVRNVVRATDESLTEVCPDIMARLFMQRVPDASSRISALNGVASTCP